MATSEKPSKKDKDTSKVHKLSLKGSARLVAEFVRLRPQPTAESFFPLIVYPMLALAQCGQPRHVRAGSPS